MAETVEHVMSSLEAELDAMECAMRTGNNIVIIDEDSAVTIRYALYFDGNDVSNK